MRFLIDINLTPLWREFLAAHGHHSDHWSRVGDPRAPDATLMSWAEQNRAVVLTHDLDFGHILAMSGAARPSVIQVRTNDPVPETIGGLVIAAVTEFEAELDAGAIVVIDAARSRLRLLPIQR